MKLFKMMLGGFVVIFGPTGLSHAGTITFNGPVSLSGTGIGSQLTVLTIQKQGSETGGVSWNGKTDLVTGDAKTGKNQTLTRTIAELTSEGIDATNLALVLQINQAASQTPLDVTTFTVNVYNSAGTIIDSAMYTPKIPSETSSLSGSGVGSSGYLFNITGLSPAVFAAPTNRIGITTSSFGNSNGGPETFFLTAVEVAVVPEPASMSLFAMSVFTFAGWRARNWRNHGKTKR